MNDSELPTDPDAIGRMGAEFFHLESDVIAWIEARARKARGVEAEAARPAASGGDSVRAAHTVAADADVDVGIPGAAGDVPVGDES